MKTKRSTWRWAAIALLIVGFAAPPSAAEAVPQWRQRRWLTYRAPIDPTIRPAVRFGRTSRYTAAPVSRGVVWRRVSR